MAASSFRAGPDSPDDASDDRTEAASEKFVNAPAVTVGLTPARQGRRCPHFDQHAKDTALFRKRLGLQDRRRWPRSSSPRDQTKCSPCACFLVLIYDGQGRLSIPQICPFSSPSPCAERARAVTSSPDFVPLKKKCFAEPSISSAKFASRPANVRSTRTGDWPVRQIWKRSPGN